MLFIKGVLSMFKIRLLSFILVIGVGQASAVKMSWDNPELGKGLHIHHQETNWTVRETRKEDLQFYQNLFRNPEVMKTMGPGKPHSLEDISKGFEEQLTEFSNGLPSGRMVLEQENKSIGYVHLRPCKESGKGEFVFAIIPEAQGNGLGKKGLGFIVNDWAPAVRTRGLGLDIDKSHPTIEKFKCFKGEPLKLIYATARPSNQASWKCFKHFDFHPSKPIDQEPRINCDGWEDTQHGSLEDYIVNRHFSVASIDRLQVDVPYSMEDEEGVVRTLSFVDEYKSLRYHFEREVE